MRVKTPSAVLNWVHTNTWNHPPPKWGPTHFDLPTNMHFQYLQDNVNLKAHKHIHPRHHDQQNSKPGKSRRPITESSVKPQNLQVQYSPGSTPKLKSHQPGYNGQQTALQWSLQAVLPTVQKKPSGKSIPKGKDQARLSCRQLDRAGNPVVSPSRPRATTLVNPSFTDPWYYKLV